jgi:hypothetical protein
MLGVSVIIPCYNAGSFLKEAVNSVHASAPQTPYEIIIVNDASTDAVTQTSLQDIAENDPLTRVFCMSQNSGQSAARNYAIQMAKYNIILPLDADDKILPTNNGSYLDKCSTILDNEPDTICVTTDYVQFGSLNGTCKNYPFNPKTHLIKDIIPPFTAFRRSELCEAGGYDESMRFAEDWEISVSLMNARHKKQQDYTVAKPYGTHIAYRTHDTGLNASVKQRIPRKDVLDTIMSRNIELYEHFYPGSSPEKLGSKVMMVATLFEMAARHPIAMSQYSLITAQRRLFGFKHRAFE